MDRKFPITKERLRNAWAYSRWVLVLLVVLSLAGWNLFYHMTSYRVPAERKVEFYIDQYGAMEDGPTALDGLMDAIHAEALPELEEVSALCMGLDDTYGTMLMAAKVSSGEGDVFLLTEQYFRQLAGNGALVPLQPLLDAGELDATGVDLTAGYDTDEATGEPVLYGIPADSFTALDSYGLIREGAYFAVIQQPDEELEHSVIFLRTLMQHLREPAAD